VNKVEYKAIPFEGLRTPSHHTHTHQKLVLSIALILLNYNIVYNKYNTKMGGKFTFTIFEIQYSAYIVTIVFEQY